MLPKLFTNSCEQNTFSGYTLKDFFTVVVMLDINSTQEEYG